MSHAPRRAAHRVAVIGHGATAIETSDLLICMGDYFVDLFSKAPAPTLPDPLRLDAPRQHGQWRQWP